MEDSDNSLSACVLRCERDLCAHLLNIANRAHPWASRLDADLDLVATQVYEAHLEMDFLDAHYENLLWQLDRVIEVLVEDLGISFETVSCWLDADTDDEEEEPNLI